MTKLEDLTVEVGVYCNLIRYKFHTKYYTVRDMPENTRTEDIILCIHIYTYFIQYSVYITRER